MTKAVAYYRVSTMAQGKSGLGLDAQRSAVHELQRVRNLDLLEEYTEVESGKDNARPKLDQALKHAKLTGAILVIAKLDRLSRNAAFLLTLRDSGVRFLAADLPDANDLTIGVLAVIAQAEREAISRRTTEALASVRRRIERDGHHTSKRSGRIVTRLGNPNGSASLQRAGKGNLAAVDGARSAADKRASELRETVEELRQTGINTPSALMHHLNQRGIMTARKRRWHVSSVQNLIVRIDALEG